MDRVAQIIDIEKRADAAEGEASDLRWEAARLIHEELAEGKTQRGIAAEIGKSQNHVFRYNRVWDRFGTESQRPTFAAACEEAAPQGPKGVTARDNDGWEPRGSGRHAAREPEEGEEARQREGASTWVRV